MAGMNPFVPKFNVDDLVSQFKTVTAPAAKARKTSEGKERGDSTRTSNKSGFPAIYALHQYFFVVAAIKVVNPWALEELCASQMKDEYPFTKNTTGKKLGNEFVRVDNAGNIMMDANGNPLTREYRAAHYSAYLSRAFEHGAWTFAEYFNFTEDDINAAVAAYRKWKTDFPQYFEKRKSRALKDSGTATE